MYLLFQRSVTFRDVAVDFSQQEWKCLNLLQKTVQGCDDGELW